MAADVELLPLPERFSFMEWETHMRDYARANVAHATAAKDAEIEALRVDVEAWKASHSMLTDTCHHFQARAERLAEAGRRVTAAFRAHGEASSFTRQAERTRHECEAAMLSLADALLRDQEEGNRNGYQ